MPGKISFIAFNFCILLSAQNNFLAGLKADNLTLDRTEIPTANDTTGVADWSNFFYNTSKLSYSADSTFSVEYSSEGVWVTDLISHEKILIDDRGSTPKWCPTKNVIAFLKMKILEGNYSIGRQLYGEDELWISGPYGENKQKLTNRTQIDDFVWSPTGESIIFCGMDSTANPFEPTYLGIIDIASGQKKIVDTGSPYNDIPFAVSPNGKMIAYSKPLAWELRTEWRVTDAEIFIADIDGSGKTQITETEVVELMLKWCSDEKSLIVEQRGPEPGHPQLRRYVKLVLKRR